MADFELVLTGSGVSTNVWLDPATEDTPSRLNGDPAHPPLYQRVIVPSVVEITAVVGGVVGPPDSSLGGRLFEVHWVEWSGPGFPVTIQSPGPAGYSSKVQINMTPGHVGHFLFAFMRPGGGGFGIHFDGAV